MSKELKGFHQIILEMPPLNQISSKNPQISYQTHLNPTQIQTQKIPVSHSIFIKKDKSSKSEFPTERTLFILNLPIDATHEKLAKVFKNQGIIEKAVWKEPIQSGASGHLIFEDEESIELCLKMKKGVWDYSSSMKSFLDWHKTPNTRELKQLVDDTMELFDEEQRQLREEEKSRSLVDEDGFVTVGKSTRRTHTDMNGASVQSIKKEVAEKLKPKDRTLQDFYRFQKREKKRNELKELREKFEEDKKKIQRMKEQRKFKPY